jgi:hypothetical protein
VAIPTIEIKRHLDAEVEKIRVYADLTEEAKGRRIADVNERAQQEYRQVVEDQEQQIKERVEKAEKAVFATPYPYAASDVEKAQIRAARRAAYDSVYGSLQSLEPGETREELERLLERAERTQYPELATAVYHVATERGERSVADAYLEKRSTEKRRWEDYVEARTEAESLNRVFDRAIGWTG